MSEEISVNSFGLNFEIFAIRKNYQKAVENIFM